MTSYLQVWAAGAEVNRATEGAPLAHTASNLFEARGITRGDRIYVGHVENRRLCLIGRLEVADIVSRRTAEQRLGADLWDARDHAFATRGCSTAKKFGIRVPDQIVRSLRFQAKTWDAKTALRITDLKLDAAGRLDPQTTRTVRRLTVGSASQLEGLLENGWIEDGQYEAEAEWTFDDLLVGAEEGRAWVPIERAPSRTAAEKVVSDWAPDGAWKVIGREIMAPDMEEDWRTHPHWVEGAESDRYAGEMWSLVDTARATLYEAGSDEDVPNPDYRP